MISPKNLESRNSPYRNEAQLRLRSEDEWLGKRVFWKDSAVVMNCTKVVDKYKMTRKKGAQDAAHCFDLTD
ncbi:MAG: hypothetical protein K9M08_15605 [Pirellula sp.]|nr:hypothetical protein [Pirellula sp.]